MAKKKTHEEFITEVELKFGSDYSILSEYVKWDVKVKVRHNKCEYTWEVLPNNFIQGKSKCPLCSNRKKLTKDEFQERIYSVLGKDYIVISDYKSVNDKLTILHEKCDYKWNVKPRWIFDKKTKCPRCQNRERYTSEDFSKIVLELTNNEYELKSKYINNRSYVEIEHLTCNNLFKVNPPSFLYLDQRCPICNDTSSKGEKRISEILTNYNVDFEQQSTFNGCKSTNLLRFDFAIKDNDVLFLVEYDGAQHFRSVEFFGGEEGFKNLQKRDTIKNQYCRDNNVPLIRIPYWKFDEIESILNKLIHKEFVEVDENYIVI
jgi:hypothetical protein